MESGSAARAKIERLLTRLELVVAHITELERGRNAEAETGAKDHAAKMIQQLAGLRLACADEA